MVALTSRFIVLVVAQKKEIRTSGWKSHLVVQSNCAKQEQVPLNSKERFVLILGHCAVACHEGYLLLLLGVWNVYYTQAGNPQTYSRNFPKGSTTKLYVESLPALYVLCKQWNRTQSCFGGLKEHEWVCPVFLSTCPNKCKSCWKSSCPEPRKRRMPTKQMCYLF